MNSTSSQESLMQQPQSLPSYFIWAVGLICAAPLILNTVGIDFSIENRPGDVAQALDLPTAQLSAAVHQSVKGAYIHTLLEWSAFCAAIFTAILAFAHYRVTRNIVTLIIGVALFFAGSMDAFHTLAADRLMSSFANNHNLIPFTWAICRTFNAVIIFGGIVFVLMRKSKDSAKSHIHMVGVSCVVFGALAYGIIHYCAVSENLPMTMFPDAIFTRPYDIVALVLFALAGLTVFPMLHNRMKSYFSQALWLSALPEVVTQMHMAFGSTALFDNHFNIAHFLKVVAYGVPLAGLCLDFVQTYHCQAVISQQSDNANTILQQEIDRNQQIKSHLEDTVSELERFNKVASNREEQITQLKQKVSQLEQNQSES